MDLQDPQTRQRFLNRLHRIEGQVRGVASMVEEGRDCKEVMQQLTSIRSSMNSAISAYLQEYARQCIINTKGKEPLQQEKILSELILMLSKAP